MQVHLHAYTPSCHPQLLPIVHSQSVLHAHLVGWQLEGGGVTQAWFGLGLGLVGVLGGLA
jgi:hypothetical protein